MNKLRIYILSVTITTSLSPFAFAKSEMNAMCYLEDKSNSVIEGTNAQNMYEIASVSKIVTSYWALRVLGPNFRFLTQIHIDPVDKNTADVHIGGGWDPYFGREMTHFLFSELQRNGVAKIRNLTFDENFLLFWSVREKPTWSIDPTRKDIEIVLRQKLRFSTAEYTATRLQAKKVGILLEPKLTTRISNVKFRSLHDYAPSPTTRTLELYSAPLVTYLKEMNRNSNNHVADHIFNFLGGSIEFQNFIKAKLDFDPNDIRLINGSGDRILVTDEKKRIQKEYNEASCEALVTIISAIRFELRINGYDLQNIMAVSGIDPDTTLGGRYASNQVSGAVVAKTGSVDPAITLAGMITTEQGNVYFGILYKTRNPSDWNTARNKIRDNVIGLMNKFGGKNEIDDYSSTPFLPFDNKSTLTAVEEKKP